MSIRCYKANPYYQTHCINLEPGKKARLPNKKGWSAMLVMRGELIYRGVGKVKSSELAIRTGHSALLSEACFPAEIKASSASELIIITPAHMPLGFV